MILLDGLLNMSDWFCQNCNFPFMANLLDYAFSLGVLSVVLRLVVRPIASLILRQFTSGELRQNTLL